MNNLRPTNDLLGLPLELLTEGRIDGCNTEGIFDRLDFPECKGAIFSCKDLFCTFFESKREEYLKNKWFSPSDIHILQKKNILAKYIRCVNLQEDKRAERRSPHTPIIGETRKEKIKEVARKFLAIRHLFPGRGDLSLRNISSIPRHIINAKMEMADHVHHILPKENDIFLSSQDEDFFFHCSLTKLQFAYSSTDGDIYIILEKFPKAALEEINLENSTCSDAGICKLAEVYGKTLKKVNLNHCRCMREEGLKHLVDKSPNLEVLELEYYGNARSVDDDIIYCIGKCPQLRKLNLGMAQIREKLLDFLAEEQHGLEVLNFAGSFNRLQHQERIEKIEALSIKIYFNEKEGFQ